MKKSLEWIKAIILLPGSALILIPGVFLFFSKYTFTQPMLWKIISGAFLMIAGLFFAVWTMRLFNNIGDGTAAPWAPPKKFVVSGPYCHVRNPMLSSVLIIILSEALLLNANILLYWLVAFWILNTIYFILLEEKDLEKRFGDDYIKYKQNVPRWIPKFEKYSLS